MKIFRNLSTEESAESVQVRQPKAGSCHAFDVGDAFARASVTGGRTSNGYTIARRSLLQVQQKCGNRWARRAVELARKAVGGGLFPEVERKIETARGGGQPLDSAVGAAMGCAFNADFGAVRVHTGSVADGLNRSLGARAFTTGRDMFFRQGEYNPGGSSGKELLAHELTHVVQQNGDKVMSKDDEAAPSRPGRSIQAKLSLGSPGDLYEQEADRMARAYTRSEALGTRTGESVNRRGIEEEKKEEAPVMAKTEDGRLMRQGDDEVEDESVRTKKREGGLQMQAEEEEEKVE